jgi:iron complex transport system ATP-binding protein
MKIRVAGLGFSYGTFDLRVDALDFAGGGVTSIVGPNGAGKSTFLKLLASVLPARPQTVFVDGQDVSRIRGRERARIVSYVPQEPSYTFNYSVLDFTLTGRAAFIPAFSSPSRADVEISREALRYVGLEDYAGRAFLELSSGERRLVLIARSLAQQAGVLLLDEPTSFLDPRHETETMGLVRRLAEEKGKTVLVTLHNLDLAVKYSDFMVFMKDGRVAASGGPGEILSEDLLRSVYDIEMKILAIDGRTIILR